MKESPPKKLVITLPSAALEGLDARGAQGDKTLKVRGPRNDKTNPPPNYTRHVTRTVELYESVVRYSDPRATHAMPDEVYELILDILRNPENLEAFHIHQLGDYLLHLPGFAARAGALRVDAAALAKTINGYGFAEKLHLVDNAQIRNAPATAVASPARRAHNRPARKVPSRRPGRASRS